MKNNFVSLKDYLPTIGILIFIGLYIYSTTLYPGGSQADLNSKDFDWLNNYWCTMFDMKALNGQPNPARPFSIIGMIILWTSLLIFFFKFSLILSSNQFWKRAIQLSATISILLASLLFTPLHDFVTTASSFFGLFTLIGILLGVAKSNLNIYKLTGLFCILLLGINNYIYYTRQFIHSLPLIQKFTFVFVLLWIIGLNHKMAQIKKIIINRN
jgi:hypothetical protein